MLKLDIQQRVVRIGDRFAMSFQRTLRIPDDGRTYPLPPGLGVFPIAKVMDYRDRLPQTWRDEEGVFIPMYQREALWLGFQGAAWKPNAVKVGIGGINAVSGQTFDDTLRKDPQDYVVVPPQPWLDGINVGHGVVRQFVAMPLGCGYTVEAALTGEEEQGGMEIVVFEPKPGVFPDTAPAERPSSPHRAFSSGGIQAMGLGGGGDMRQKIYTDPYGMDVWDQNNFGKIRVHIVSSGQYHEITGAGPPPTPIDAVTYTKHGFPWFDLYDEALGGVVPSERLTTAKTIAEVDAERGTRDDEQAGFDVPETQIKKLRPENSNGSG